MIEDFKSQPITTLLVIIIGLIVISRFFEIKWLMDVCIVIGVLGLVSEKIAFIIEFVWIRLAVILSYIIPNILLAIVFYFILFPLSIASKIFLKRDLLMISKNYNSLWVKNNRKVNKNYFHKTW